LLQQKSSNFAKICTLQINIIKKRIKLKMSYIGKLI
jgi:hypothetical protein